MFEHNLRGGSCPIPLSTCPFCESERLTEIQDENNNPLEVYIEYRCESCRVNFKWDMQEDSGIEYDD